MSPLGVVSVVQRGTSQRFYSSSIVLCVRISRIRHPAPCSRTDGRRGISVEFSRDFFFKKKELGSSLPDGVASPETNPLRDGTVLLLSFGKLLLGAERLVALFHI